MTSPQRTLNEVMNALAKECDANDWRHQGVESYSPMDNEDFFKAGFRAALELPEVKALCEALDRVVEEYSQDTVNEPIGSVIARIDNANHFIKEALAQFKKFKETR